MCFTSIIKMCLKKDFSYSRKKNEINKMKFLLLCYKGEKQVTDDTENRDFK